MRFNCSKDELSKMLDISSASVPSKSTNPVLQNIYFEISEKDITVKGTDTELTIQSILSAEIIKPGAFTVNASKLLKIIKSFPAGCSLNFDVDERYNITITPSTNSKLDVKFAIQGTSIDDYPIIKDASEVETFVISQPTLKDMIKKTIYSASKEDSRRHLQGIFFEYIEGELRLVATDGRRLSIAKTKLEYKYPEFKAMVPLKTLNDILKILDLGDCEIGITETQIFFKIGNIQVTSSLIESDFINYAAVIPETSSQKIVVDTNQVSSATSRVSSILTTDGIKKLVFDIKKDTCEISTNSSSNESAKETITLQTENKPIIFALNSDYIRDVLSVIKTMNVEIGINTPTSPLIITEENNTNFIAVIGPMKLEG